MRAPSTVPITGWSGSSDATSVNSALVPLRKPDARRGRMAARPVHLPGARLEPVRLHQRAHGVVETGTEPRVVLGGQRQLVGRARDVRLEHERVLRVHDRGLGRTGEQLVGVLRVPLVELVVAGDEHRGGAPVRATGAAGLLAQRREGAREAVDDDGVEAADVDAELERVGGGDPEQLAVGEPAFELPALLGQVAGTVRGDRGRPRAGARGREDAPGVPGDELRAAAAAGEGERGVTGGDEPRQELGGLDVRRRPRAGGRVEQRPLPEREAALGLG